MSATAVAMPMAAANGMSTLSLAGIGVLVWLAVCMLVVAACVMARRGDEAITGETEETARAAGSRRDRHRARSEARRDRASM